MKDTTSTIARMRRGIVATLVVASGTAVLSATPASAAATSAPVVSGATSYVSGQLATVSVAVTKKPPRCQRQVARNQGSCDTDGDRLSDAKEANLGTSPTNPDTDGDSVKDGDEVLGTTTGVNLPAMGFSALHKDLAVEFDWYNDALECGAAHSHRPTVAMINRLTGAYAAVALPNPDGTPGIHLIADYGQGGAFLNGTVLTGDPSGIDDLGPSYYAIKAASFDAKRNGIFHYVLMGHRFPGADQFLGTGELLGDDVALDADCSWNNTDLVAGALFHELGHNLSLRHGGNEDANFKPNYLSTMNYRWGGDGVDTNCDNVGDGLIGYSDGSRAPLDENALIEANGVCGPGFPIDWNGNGIIDPGPIAFNINPDNGPELSVLTDNNDLAQISFAGILDAD